MADKDYIYEIKTGQPLIASLRVFMKRGPGMMPTLVAADAVPQITLRIDEAQKRNLDQAMRARGWKFVAEAP